jgi:hypothetical protein
MRIGWKPKFNDPRVASVRFRCLTPMRALQQTGVRVEIFDPRQAEVYSLVVFSKLYDPTEQAIARALRSQGCRTILDLSDNHFYNPHGLPQYAAAATHLRAMVALVDRVVCCSPEMARVVALHTAPARPPLVVGDAVEDFAVVRTRSVDRFRILWFGSHGSPNAASGMEDLLRIRDHLGDIARTHPAELVIVSNNAQKFAALQGALPVPSRYVEWTPVAFAKELSRADLVVVPVTPNPFTFCKSNNRVATALWHGVPVLADRIPAYDELAPFAYVDDWERGFLHALSDVPDLAERTEAGRRFVREGFNNEVIAAAWRRAFEVALETAGIA